MTAADDSILPGDWQRLRSQADPNVILMTAADDSILPGDWQHLRSQADPNVLPYEGDGDAERPRTP
jgi:hypothetical protein